MAFSGFGLGDVNLAPGALNTFKGQGPYSWGQTAGLSSSFGGGSGGFNWGRAGGILSLANMGLGMMGMNNTNRSFSQMQQTAGLMRDIDFGTNLFAQNKDIFEQKDAPRWASKFQVDDPNFRQYDMRQAIRNPGLAGRYTAFVA